MKEGFGISNTMALTLSKPSGITVKSQREISYMREAGLIAATAKLEILEVIDEGITTSEIDSLAEGSIRRQGGIPAFKGLYGFPATICASINEELVHGIPSDRALKYGDIFSVDIGAIVGGFYSDTAFTVGVGKITKKAQKLINATHGALHSGISKVIPGARIGDISSSIQNYAEELGYGVVKQYVGHGIGRSLHEDPQVPNFGSPGHGIELREGMTIAIEPMLNVGTWETKVQEDEWTVVTADGELSAHFEETVAVTKDGCEILTALD